MISLAMFVAVLVIPSSATWAEVGEKNIATLRQMNALSKAMKGADITPKLMEELSEKMMAYFPATMSCHAAEVRLTDVPPRECFLAVGQRMSDSGNVKVMNWDLTNLAIDPATEGKTILTYQPGDVVGTSMGEILPGTRVGDMVINYMYDFNDEGLIKAFTMDFDSSILHGISQKVQTFNAAMARGKQTFLVAGSSSWRTAGSKNEKHLHQDPSWSKIAMEATAESNSWKEEKAILLDVEESNRQSSWKEAGERNMATVQHLDEISKQLMGEHVTPAALAKLSDATQALYAPQITCVTAKGSGVGVHLMDVTSGECFQAVGKAWSNIRMVDFKDKNLAIDPNTEGKTILTRMVADFVGVTGAGQEVPGTSQKARVINFRYRFNSEGLIAHWEQEFDTGMLRSVDMKVGQSQFALHLLSNGYMKSVHKQWTSQFDSPGGSAFATTGLFPGVLAWFAIAVMWVCATIAVMGTFNWVRRTVQWRRQPILEEAWLG